jgi:hypothetical protein
VAKAVRSVQMEVVAMAISIAVKMEMLVVSKSDY